MTRPTPETLAAIEGLARKATSGPLEATSHFPDEGDHHERTIAETTRGTIRALRATVPATMEQTWATIDMCAALDPQTVLGLVEALREAWARVEELDGELGRMAQYASERGWSLTP